MNKQTINVPNLSDENLSSEALFGNFETYLLDLFSTSPNVNLAENHLDMRISALTQKFLHELKVSSDTDIKSIVEKFQDSKIPVEPLDVENYVDYLHENIVAHSIHTASPRFIGHMTSALPYFVRPLGKLMTAMNQNLVKMETSKAWSPFERQALAMMHRLIYKFSDDFYQKHIQNNQSTLGIITSGGTLANITALWCARNFSLGQKDTFAGVENEGLPAALNFYGYQGAVIIGSSLMHYSFKKAVGLLGIGERGLIEVPVDSHNRIDLSLLRKTVDKCRDRQQHIIAIVGIAGTTDCGSIDPLAEIAEIAKAANTHFHVDAAWGGPVLFSEKHHHKLAGIELSDSVTIDGHKQLYLPMGIGMTILRNPQMAKVIEKSAPYTVRKKSIDLGKYSLEGSRPSMSLFLQAALHIIGHKGYEFLIDQGIDKTNYMANSIAARAEFELLLKPEINILLYRYIPQHLRPKVATGNLTDDDNHIINEFNKCLQDVQCQAGNTFVSRTTVTTTSYGTEMPIVALRAVIANPLTTESDIEAVLEDQINIATKLPVFTSENQYEVGADVDY